jgi:hypothetical protein
VSSGAIVFLHRLSGHPPRKLGSRGGREVHHKHLPFGLRWVSEATDRKRRVIVWVRRQGKRGGVDGLAAFVAGWLVGDLEVRTAQAKSGIPESKSWIISSSRHRS